MSPADEYDVSPLDQPLIDLLQRRHGQPTAATLADGRVLQILNIAWGYDMGDAYAHITTNVSPSQYGLGIDFFYSSEVAEVHDASGELIWPPSESA